MKLFIAEIYLIPFKVLSSFYVIYSFVNIWLIFMCYDENKVSDLFIFLVNVSNNSKKAFLFLQTSLFVFILFVFTF